jgi:DNA (cytosine-5)-methyltransferase 1
MIGATFCSGIGAPEVAAPWVNWQVASEIEKFPREVLQHRFGHRDARHHREQARLWGDLTALRVRHFRRLNIPFPNIIVAGTPCQSFSVAGLRKGLSDDRGNLTLQFVRTAHAIQSARPDGKLIVLWENVPGVLSDRGNAFGAFLGGMVGAMDALPSPDGVGWPREGMVEGPRARAAWAVLDAQWFGVAQRRRRVFVVFDFGNCVDPAAALFDRDSLRGDSPPSRSTGEVAPTIPARSLGGGGLGTDFDCDGGVIASEHPYAGTVSSKWAKGTGGPAGDECQNLVAHSLQGGDGQVAPQLTTGGGKPGQGQPCVAFDCKGTEVQYTEDGSHPTLRSMGHLSSHQNAGGHAAVAFDLRGRDGGAMPEGPYDTANLRAASGGSSRSYIAHPWAVRRLTPRECERLQGFPDDHTLIPRDRKRVLKDMEDEMQYLLSEYPDMTPEEAIMLAADGPRYKALGNSMAVPVIRWIMDRIRESAKQMEDAK